VNTKPALNIAVLLLLAFACCLPLCAGPDNAPKVLFTFHAPGEKAPLVGFFYSADEEEAISFEPANSDKAISIPFRKIRQMTLTRGPDRFSKVTVKLTDGSSVSGRIGPLNVLFIDPKRDRPFDLPLSDPDDHLADYGDRQSVLCALGTFTQQ
jgi:hypothetical protein